MRQTTDRAVSDISHHGEAKRALVMYHLSTASGIRIFCRTMPPDSLIGTGGQIRFADGTWLADGSASAGEGAEALLGIHDWVEDGGSFSLGLFSGTSALEAFRDKELSSLSLTLNNDQGPDAHPRMSQIIATEPIVGGRLDVRAGFAGQDIGDVVALGSFTVRRVSERRGSITLECEGT